MRDLARCSRDEEIRDEEIPSTSAEGDRNVNEGVHEARDDDDPEDRTIAGEIDNDQEPVVRSETESDDDESLRQLSVRRSLRIGKGVPPKLYGNSIYDE